MAGQPHGTHEINAAWETKWLYAVRRRSWNRRLPPVSSLVAPTGIDVDEGSRTRAQGLRVPPAGCRPALDQVRRPVPLATGGDRSCASRRSPHQGARATGSRNRVPLATLPWPSSRSIRCETLAVRSAATTTPIRDVRQAETTSCWACGSRQGRQVAHAGIGSTEYLKEGAARLSYRRRVPILLLHAL